MADGMTFSESLKNEKKKWKNMNGKQRFDYFKSYYLVPTVIILFLLALLISFLYQTIFNRKFTLLNGIVFNAYMKDETIDDFQKDYLEFLDGDPKNEEVTLGYNHITETEYASLMMLQANVGSMSLDFLLLDEEAYELLKNQEMFGNLNDFVDADTLKEYEAAGKVLTTHMNESDVEYPAGLDVSDTAFIQKYMPEQKIYLVYIINAPDTEELSHLLEFLNK